MKNRLFIFIILIGIFASCETYTDYKVEYSPVYPLSGEWYVQKITNDTIFSTNFSISISNLPNNVSDMILLKGLTIGESNKEKDFKVSADPITKEFSITDSVIDLDIPITTIWNSVIITSLQGKVFTNQLSSDNKVLPDSIEFEMEYKKVKFNYKTDTLSVIFTDTTFVGGLKKIPTEVPISSEKSFTVVVKKTNGNDSTITTSDLATVTLDYTMKKVSISNNYTGGGAVIINYRYETIYQINTNEYIIQKVVKMPKIKIRGHRKTGFEPGIGWDKP